MVAEAWARGMTLSSRYFVMKYANEERFCFACDRSLRSLGRVSAHRARFARAVQLLVACEAGNNKQ